MDYILRGAFLVVLLVCATDMYIKTRALIRETHWYGIAYVGLALSAFVILFVTLHFAAIAFLGAFLLLLSGRAGLQSLKSCSIRDYLTNLYTRLYFFEEWFPREAKRQKRAGGSIAFAVLDVDGLKRVNDEEGHTAGDKLLVRLSQAVLANIRAEDIAVRFGGDEILLAFPGGNEEGARKALQRIAEILEDISFSFGVGVWEGKGKPENAIRQADHRMYEEKRRKKENTAEPFSSLSSLAD